MPAGIYHFTVANGHHIEQGATWDQSLTWLDDDGEPIDLTGYTARMQIRQSTNSPSHMAEITTENDKISLNELGNIQIFLEATETQTYDWDNPGVYDIELVAPNGRVVRLLKGNIDLDKEVTR